MEGKTRNRRGRITEISMEWDPAHQDLPDQGFKNRNSRYCYRNAALQILFHTPPFINWLSTHDGKTCVQFKSGLQCIACALRDLKDEYWRPGGSKDLETVLRSFWIAATKQWWGSKNGAGPDKPSTENGDAEEFLFRIIDRIQAQLPSETALLERLFTLSVRRTWECNQCSFKTTVKESSPSTNCMVIDEKQGKAAKTTKKSVFDGIQFAMQNDEEPRRCSLCDAGSGTPKPADSKLIDAPEICFVFINRTYYQKLKNGTTVTKKARTANSFTEELDLASAFPTRRHGLEARYRLYGVVRHRGEATSKTGGHVVVDVRGPRDEWHEIDDETVGGVQTFQAIEKAQRDTKIPMAERFFPSILAYRRIDTSDLPSDRTKPKATGVTNAKPIKRKRDEVQDGSSKKQKSEGKVIIKQESRQNLPQNNPPKSAAKYNPNMPALGYWPYSTELTQNFPLPDSEATGILQIGTKGLDKAPTTQARMGLEIMIGESRYTGILNGILIRDKRTVESGFTQLPDDTIDVPPVTKAKDGDAGDKKGKGKGKDKGIRSANGKTPMVRRPKAVPSSKSDVVDLTT